MIERYTLFIGWGRSGHSLIGSFLDAHPDCVITHEHSSVRRLHRAEYQVTFDSHVQTLIKKSKRQADRGRRVSGDPGHPGSGYSQLVPGLFNGRVRNLKVVGDKEGGGLPFYQRKFPDALPRFIEWCPVPVVFICVIRNPWDMLATWEKKPHGDGFKKRLNLPHNTLRRLETNCKQVRKMIRRFKPYRLYYEDLFVDFEGQMCSLLDWLGLDSYCEHLKGCKDILFPKPTERRFEAKWKRSKVERVGEVFRQFRFFDRYTYDGRDYS